MKRRWIAVTVAVFAVWLLAPPATWAQVDAKGDEKSPGVEAQRRMEAERLAQETAQKAALAEWIIGREEAASGRAFEPGFRATVAKGLTALPWPTLQSQLPQSGLGPYNLGDSQADLVYTPVTPCRIIDTRLAGGPLAPGTPRDFVVAGDASAQGGTNCGVPLGPATAAVINFVAVGPAGPGDLRVTPLGTPMPLASILNYAGVSGLNIANGLVVTMCDPATTTCLSDITIQADVSGTDVVADVQGYFRKVRKEQARSFVVTGQSVDTTPIGAACTHYTSAEVTVVAPVAGRILVRVNAIVRINHVLGTRDLLNLFVGASPTDCSLALGFATEYDVPAEAPTTAVRPHTTVPLFAVFDVTPGTFTYFLNGLMLTGQDPYDLFWYAGLEATFFPN